MKTLEILEVPNSPEYSKRMDKVEQIWHRNSTLKVSQYLIDYERRIHVKTLTSIRQRQLNVNSFFKIDETSMSFLRDFFDAISMLNRRNFHYLKVTYSRLSYGGCPFGIF